MESLTAKQRERVLELHRTLVSIQSCNTSVEQANRDRAEEAIGHVVADFLADIGMRIERHALAPGRDSLTAHWPMQTGEKTVALQAHLDTVGVENMTRPPFEAAVENGRIYGRGACDTKGSLASFLAALAFAHESGFRPVDKWYFIATVGEEIGCLGAKSLAASGFRVDGVVVGEPTRCRVVTAHKGQVWVRLKASGISCHSSEPEHGRNAISAMSRAVVWCDDVFSREFGRRKHNLLGCGTLSVGTIHGGTVANIVPARCEAVIDFRTLPDEDPARVGDKLLAGLRRDLPEWADQFRVEYDLPNSGLETSHDRPFARNLISVCRERSDQKGPVGVHYFADSGAFNAAGMETVLFGPGDIAQAHTADEFLEVDQLNLATEIALEWLLGSERRSVFS